MMKGKISDIEDEYTVLVTYRFKGKEETARMRVVEYKKSSLCIGMKVKFDLNDRGMFGRICCKVIDESEYDRIQEI